MPRARLVIFIHIIHACTTPTPPTTNEMGEKQAASCLGSRTRWLRLVQTAAGIHMRVCMYVCMYATVVALTSRTQQWQTPTTPRRSILLAPKGSYTAAAAVHVTAPSVCSGGASHVAPCLHAFRERCGHELDPWYVHTRQRL